MVARFEYESLRSYEVRTCSVGRGMEAAEKDVTILADLNSRYVPTLKTEINELRQHLEQILVKVGNKVQEAIALYVLLFQMDTLLNTYNNHNTLL